MFFNLTLLVDVELSATKVALDGEMVETFVVSVSTPAVEQMKVEFEDWNERVCPLEHPPATSPRSDTSEFNLLTARQTSPAPSASSANTRTDNTITPKITARVEVLINDSISYGSLLDFTVFSFFIGSILERYI